MRIFHFQFNIGDLKKITSNIWKQVIRKCLKCVYKKLIVVININLYQSLYNTQNNQNQRIYDSFNSESDLRMLHHLTSLNIPPISAEIIHIKTIITNILIIITYALISWYWWIVARISGSLDCRLIPDSTECKWWWWCDWYKTAKCCVVDERVGEVGCCEDDDKILCGISWWFWWCTCICFVSSTELKLWSLSIRAIFVANDEWCDEWWLILSLDDNGGPTSDFCECRKLPGDGKTGTNWRLDDISTFML